MDELERLLGRYCPSVVIDGKLGYSLPPEPDGVMRESRVLCGCLGPPYSERVHEAIRAALRSYGEEVVRVCVRFLGEVSQDALPDAKMSGCIQGSAESLKILFPTAFKEAK